MLKVAMIFNDNMVLQRGKTIKVWGTDIPKNIIEVSILDDRKSCLVDNNGNWIVELPQINEVMYDIEITITNQDENIIFKNICVGEVWIASGQSNMEYYLQFDAEREEEFSSKQRYDIRFFDYPKISYKEQIFEHNYEEFGCWRLHTREDLPYFSAVAFYFSKFLNMAMNVPIGIVCCSWGGTPACTWLDSSYLENNEGSIWLEDYKDRIKNLDINGYVAEFKNDRRTDRSKPFDDEVACRLMYPGLSIEEQADFSENTAPLEIGPLDERRPGGLYETMIKNIAPFSVAGVIWYQGESDDKYASVYSIVFGNLIKCWRELWKEKLPFLYVQLAPFEKWLHVTEKNFVNIRKEQELVSKTLENVWMASSSDCGMRYDIHPKHKKPIGKRLSLLARKYVYNEPIIGGAPKFLEAIKDGDNIYIKFENAEGLHIVGNKINALYISDKYDVSIVCDEEIIDDCIILKGSFNNEVKISFAMTNFYEVNLYNKEKNPMLPFEVIL